VIENGKVSGYLMRNVVTLQPKSGKRRNIESRKVVRTREYLTPGEVERLFGMSKIRRGFNRLHPCNVFGCRIGHDLAELVGGLNDRRAVAGHLRGYHQRVDVGWVIALEVEPDRRD